ncbi:MAG: hypothetical protein FWF59_09370 [Turicibacter sp.]|nr:hypothetical protein [Turicibacter sp.]
MDIATACSLLVKSGLPQGVVNYIRNTTKSREKIQLEEMQGRLEACKLSFNLADKAVESAVHVLRESLKIERAHSAIFLNGENRYQDFIYNSDLNDYDKADKIVQSKSEIAHAFKRTQQQTTDRTRAISGAVAGGAIAATGIGAAVATTSISTSILWGLWTTTATVPLLGPLAPVFGIGAAGVGAVVAGLGLHHKKN